MLEPNKFVCTGPCKTEKSRVDFGTVRKHRNKWCKICCAEAVRKTYASSIEYRQSCRDGKVKRSLENHRYIYGYLKSHPCVDCRESDPLVLQFDHVDLTEKRGCVTGFSGSSRQRIEEEISRCVIRCANCHAKKTAQERNSIRYQLFQEELNPEFLVKSEVTPKSRPKATLSPSEAGKIGAARRWHSA
jgi:hypothetical protein